MSDEEAFHRAIDETPTDHLLYLVFADWLQEHDNPRAVGYRALGLKRKVARYGIALGGTAGLCWEW